MLVLSRKINEDVKIFLRPENLAPGVIEITVKIIDVCAGKVRLGFEAPKDVIVHRKEVADAIVRNGEKVA